LLNQYSTEGLLFSQEITNNFEYDPGKRYLEQVFKSILASMEHVYYNLVEGDIIEFGTGYGLTANMLAYSNKTISQSYNYPSKKLNFFDSFEGLPEITNKHDQKTPWKKGDFKAATPADIYEICTRHINQDKVHVFEGWFNDSLPRLNTDTLLSLIHIDSDLFESAQTVLDYIFMHRLVAEGAIILFDDYNCNRASNILGERRAWSESVEKFNINFSSIGAYSPFGWKFIIHSYQT